MPGINFTKCKMRCIIPKVRAHDEFLIWYFFGVCLGFTGKKVNNKKVGKLLAGYDFFTALQDCVINFFISENYFS